MLLKNKSLINKLFLSYLIIALIPIFAFSVYFTINTKKKSINEELRILSKTSNKLAEDIDNYLVFNQQLVRLFAAYTDKICPHLFDNVKGNKCKGFENWLKEQIKIFPQISVLYLLNSKGDCIISTEPTFLTKNYSFREYFTEAMKKKYYKSDWSIGVTSKKAGIYLSSPITTNNVVKGVIVLKLSTEPISKLLYTWHDRNKHKDAFILNQNGILISHTDSSFNYRSISSLPQKIINHIQQHKQFADKKILNLGLKELDSKFKNLLAKGGTRTCEYKLNNQGKIAVLTKLNEENWVVGITVYKKYLYSGIRKIISSALSIIIFCVLIALGMGFIFSRKIFNPISKLTETVNEFGKGNYKIRTGIKTEDEVGKLSETFDKMADTLQKYTDDLEVLVKKRTAELKKMADKAKLASKAKSEFVANMSHEIRTPLNGIIGASEIISNTEMNNEQTSLIKTIKKSGTQLLAIINDILDFSKIEAGKLELQTRAFSLRSEINELIRIFKSKALIKKLEFIVFIQPEIPDNLIGDPVRLKQIITNLIANSFKFTSKGEISVSISIKNKSDKKIKLLFSVKDTGIGIPPNKSEQLFNQFSQLDSSTTKKFGGTGLGLAISKQLSEMMNGNIGIKNHNESPGAEVWFSAEFEIGHDKAPELSFSTGIRKLCKILVADDNLTSRRSIEKYINHWEISTISAEDGKSAIEEVKNASENLSPANIAIIDSDIVDVKNLDLIREMKENSNGNIKVIVMFPEYKHPSEKNKYSNISDIDFIVDKPITQISLYNSIYHVLTGKPVQEATIIEESHVLDSIKNTGNNKISVLIVEDNSVNLMIVSKILSRFGFLIETACNGKEAVEVLSKKTFDIVFMDIQMPEMDGFEATKIIRDTSSTVINHDIIIIALTAHALTEYRKKCLDSGMNDYISKPFDMKNFIDVVQKWIHKIDSTQLNSTVFIKSSDKNPITELEEDNETVFNKLKFLKNMMDDNDFANEILNNFLIETPENIDKIEKNIKLLSYKAVERLAHNVKGASGLICAEELLGISSKIEQAAKSQNINKLNELYKTLQNEYKKLEMEITKHYKI